MPGSNTAAYQTVTIALLCLLLLTAPTTVKVPYIATAVVRHLGDDFTRGHYTTLVRNTTAPASKWVMLDDARVRGISHTEVVNKDAYMLLFRRLDSF